MAKPPGAELAGGRWLEGPLCPQEQVPEAMKDDGCVREALEQVFLVLICSGAWPHAASRSQRLAATHVPEYAEELMIMDAARLASPFGVACAHRGGVGSGSPRGYRSLVSQVLAWSSVTMPGWVLALTKKQGTGL